MIAFNNGFNDGKRYGRYGFIVPDSIDRTQKDYREGFYAGYASGFLDGASTKFSFYCCHIHSAVLCEYCFLDDQIKALFCIDGAPARYGFIQYDSLTRKYYANSATGASRYFYSHVWSYYEKLLMRELTQPKVTIKCDFCGISKEV